MKKMTIVTISLAIILSSTAQAADNVYVKLSCENNQYVDITLNNREQTGWANLTTQNGTKRADYFAGTSNNMGGDRLAFAARGIVFDIDYSASKEFFLTLISETGRTRYSCKLV